MFLVGLCVLALLYKMLVFYVLVFMFLCSSHVRGHEGSGWDLKGPGASSICKWRSGDSSQVPVDTAPVVL